jgi:two-component system, NarL family, sensor kinase
MDDKSLVHPEFTAKLFEALEREHRLLAQELHDGLNQEFAVLTIEMNRLEGKLNESEARQLRSIRERLEGLIQTTRSIARRLHPLIVDDLGLIAALRALCQAFSVPPIVVSFAEASLTADLHADTAVCLYRVAEESIRNAVKHSGSHHIQVRLSEIRRQVILTVQDLGKGFDVSDAANKNGLGLESMAQRVRFVDGDFSIRSAPDRGTLISVTVPLQSF